MRLRSWIIGSFALLGAGAAQAQGKIEHHVKVGEWEIAAEPERTLCKMYRYYGSSVDDHIEGLIVRYDAAKESGWLTWSTNGSTPFTEDEEIDLFLTFVKGKSLNEAWSARSFHQRKHEDTRYFAHGFHGSKESRRILRDFAESELIGLDLGPVMMTALSLDAAKATDALRECSLKIAASTSPDPLLK